MRRFTEQQVCEITGAKPGSVESWVDWGVLDGLRPHRRQYYTLSEVIAIAAAVVYLRETAMLERCIGVGRLLAAMPVERLEAELAAGRTFPVPVGMLGYTPGNSKQRSIPGMMIEPPETNDPLVKEALRRLDLKKVYQHVMSRVNPKAPAKTMPKAPTQRNLKVAK